MTPTLTRTPTHTATTYKSSTPVNTKTRTPTLTRTATPQNADKHTRANRHTRAYRHARAYRYGHGLGHRVADGDHHAHRPISIVHNDSATAFPYSKQTAQPLSAGDYGPIHSIAGGSTEPGRILDKFRHPGRAVASHGAHPCASTRWRDVGVHGGLNHWDGERWQGFSAGNGFAQGRSLRWQNEGAMSGLRSGVVG